MSHPRVAIVCGEKRIAPEGDYFVTCSFDPNHVLLRSRMPYHIVKCVKQHAGHNKVQCPYDSTEYIDVDKFKEHLEKCESQVSLSEEKYELAALKESGRLFGFKQTPFFHQSHPEPTEDWGGRKTPEAEKENNNENDDIYDNEKDVSKVQEAMRGVHINQPEPKKKVLGRGEMILLLSNERYVKDYEEQKLRESSTNDDDDNESDDESEEEEGRIGIKRPERGVGRGVGLKRPAPKKRGFGRAEMLARILKEYEEEKLRAQVGSRGSASSSSIDSLRETVVEDQFSDV